MGDAIRWGPWQTLKEGWPGGIAGLRETLLGGQAFRWREVEPHLFEGVWEGNCVQLREDGGILGFRACEALRVEPDAVREYLAMDMDWEDLADTLPWRSDPILKRGMTRFPGLRLLRQPPEETLLCFLCSSNKQIRQIRQITEALSSRLGEALWKGSPVSSLPTWEILAGATESDLLACRMGYRAKHVLGCAGFLAARTGFLDEVAGETTPAGKELLQELPGVGPKVAECILLFGFGKLDAFPIDTWILKILEREYGLTGWNRRQIEQFGRLHFGDAAGLAQQYLFAQARWDGLGRSG